MAESVELFCAGCGKDRTNEDEVRCSACGTELRVSKSLVGKLTSTVTATSATSADWEGPPS